MDYWNKKKIGAIILIVFLVAFFGGLYLWTGFLKESKIDERDLSNWEYDETGVILGAKEFTLNGSGDTCWYMIHGYTSTPDEMREIAEGVHSEFNETVMVTRLRGSGEIPSKIVNLTLYDWYDQASEELDVLNERCDDVNLVGFSFGGALSARLAEEKEVNNIYLLSPYIFATYEPYRIFKVELYLDIFADSIHYAKKTKIGQINSQEALDKHIAYWNMPLAPIKYSKPFFQEVRDGLGKIENPILLQQSKNDATSDFESSIYIYDNVASENKELIAFELSNHIIPEDYDKEEVIENIINFERKIRE
jgi:carboxylesterase